MGANTVKALAFESRPSHHVTGLFYLPKEGNGPFPAVYIPCGHAPNSKAMYTYQKAARLFAINGFAVLQADPVCQGERFQFLNEQGKPKTRGGTPGAAIRKGHFKFIEFFEDKPSELHDLESDMGEQKDLSSTMTDKAQELRELLHEWQKFAGARFPSENPNRNTISLRDAGKSGKVHQTQ